MEELAWAEQVVLSRAFTSDIAKGEEGVRSSRMGAKKAPEPPKNAIQVCTNIYICYTLVQAYG